MTNPSPPPGITDLVAPALVGATAVLAPLGMLLGTAVSLFGHGTPRPSPPAGDGHPSVDPGAHAGPSADAEAAAGKQLAGQTDTLKDLDKQLDDLSQKIADQNDVSKKKLLDIKTDVDKELDYINTSGDDNVVKSGAVSQFLQDKAGDIAKVITDAADTVNKNQSQLQDIGDQYGQPGGGTGGGGDVGAGDGSQSGGYPPSGGSPYGQGAGYGDGYGDDDPAGELGATLPQLASSIPGALSGLNPLSSLGGLGDLGSLIGDAVHGGGNDHNPDQDKPDGPHGNNTDQDPQPKHDQAGQAGDPSQQSGQQASQQQQQQQPAGSPSSVPPPAPPAPSLVKRPDGTSATAVSPAVAAAASAHLGGASLEDAYKAAGITLPPPGTPIKDTLASLSMAQVGDLAVFKDRYVMLLGDGKIYLDGQEEPVSALAKMTGFLGFCHPPASSTPNVAVVSSSPAVPPVPVVPTSSA